MQDALDKEMSWRVKEIGSFTVAAKANGPQRRFFIRAGVALLYAHWEGFIKSSSDMYLNYIHNKSLSYADLKSCFAVMGLKSKLNMLRESKKSKANVEAFEFITSELGKTASIYGSNYIDTESNLTSIVFSNIAQSLDIEIDAYQMHFNLIDQSLVHRRNKIAHGEYIDIGGKEFSDLVENVLLMMRNYKTDLENAASLEKYKRPATTSAQPQLPPS
ncbi:hypothetical protein GBB76_11660 [Ancylobacter sp. TS-1]|nr:hypothetical protein GBB76_11660 [Ancylobacter sp. TS-1]